MNTCFYCEATEDDVPIVIYVGIPTCIHCLESAIRGFKKGLKQYGISYRYIGTPSGDIILFIPDEDYEISGCNATERRLVYVKEKKDTLRNYRNPN